MGWNSWDAYGLTITETQFRDNVGVQAKLLKPFGWNYAVIDEGWFLKNPLDRETPEKLAFELDENGRYIPVGEERGEIPGSDKTHRWIVDPLDGTTNFLHAIPHFAINVALERDGQVVAAVTYNPATNDMFWAERRSRRLHQ